VRERERKMERRRKREIKCKRVERGYEEDSQPDSEHDRATLV